MSQPDRKVKILNTTFWYLLCDFIINGIAFITMPIFNRLLTVDQIGKYSSLTSWISILSVVVTLNLVPSVLLAKYDYSDEYDNYISSVALLGIVSSLFFYFFCLFFRHVIENTLGFDNYTLNIVCVYLVFCQIPSILLAKYRVNQDYKKTVALSLFLSFFTTIASLVCTIVFKNRLLGRVSGLYLSYVIVGFVAFVLFVYKRKSFKISFCKYALAISCPLIIHNLAGNIMHLFDRIMIERLDSSYNAGLYGVAYSCAMIANILRNSMNAAWEPWVYEKLDSNNQDEIKKTSYMFIIAFSLLCIGIILIAPELLYLVGGEVYVLSKSVVPPVVLAYMFSMIYNLYASIEQYYKKQTYFALVASVCAGLNIFLNYYFIKKYGYIASAYTTVFCMALEFFLHFLNVKKMGYSHLYNTKFNFGMLFFMTIFSGLSLVIYSCFVLRYIVLCIYLVIISLLIIKYKKIFIACIDLFLHKQ